MGWEMCVLESMKHSKFPSLPDWSPSLAFPSREQGSLIALPVAAKQQQQFSYICFYETIFINFLYFFSLKKLILVFWFFGGFLFVFFVPRVPNYPKLPYRYHIVFFQ